MTSPPESGTSRVPRRAPPAYLFFGVFSAYPELITECGERIRDRFGAFHADGVSPLYPFPDTRTYEKTMGKNLQRQFFTLAEPQPQDSLARIKHAAIELERELTEGGAYEVVRPVNIDPGILNDCRVILASTKDYAHRLYRGDGIWEELTLIYQHGEFTPLPWTYPDFRATTYHEFFARLRRDLLHRNAKR